MRPTIEDIRNHLRTGTEVCLVCDSNEKSGAYGHFVGEWTDSHGEIRCYQCGMTYQTRRCAITEEFLTELGLTASEVVFPYCTHFFEVPLARVYWKETHNPLPFGTYLSMEGRIVQAWQRFGAWLRENADQYRPHYEDHYHWDRIMARKDSNEG